jgi:hypothetical protein
MVIVTYISSDEKETTPFETVGDYNIKKIMIYQEIMLLWMLIPMVKLSQFLHFIQYIAFGKPLV